MNLSDLIPNKYIREARIYPFLIAALPIGLAIFIWFPDELAKWKPIAGSAGVWIVAAMLISQFVRDAGAKKQKRLFEVWGGTPTTKLLRHENARNPIMLERTHKKLEQLLSSDSELFKLPTKEEEKNDPVFADQKYELCVSYLRNNTRDTDKFNLLFIENCSYGFRRNLWGLKIWGIVILILSILMVFYKLLTSLSYSEFTSVSEVIVTLFLFILLSFWIFLINKQWVKEAAYRYAQALIDSCDYLPANKSDR
ncbi:hypothetical protein [Cyclobacterium sp. SYSU L10401]|uniref:hypothetical protein n=1 Tax=Cyclobacterium sp. SYSU L10401 TaxID=2678657 RepID=UPI0013D3E499|nr:hypothetical protein [Cyclobacterium sp. SYSU L10401]